jgi:ubiquinone/menaquinone biosynthesis C-methylase UbiE
MMAKETEHETLVADRKRALLSGLHGNVLEIGPGTGPNLTYYPRDIHWLGIEPNPAMYPYVEKEARRLGLQIELRDGHAETLDAPDNSMDAVVSTLVFCSVRDPKKALQEVLRVLKPGGRFVFVEHVAAPRNTGSRRFQSFIRPVWSLFSDGCHPDRETWTAIEKAGFSQVKIDHFRIPAPIIGPHISGFAVK